MSGYQVLRGEGRSMCPTCGEYFSSTENFDSHRVGRFDGERRCLTLPELLALGWQRNVHGFLFKPPRGHRSAALQGPSECEAVSGQGVAHGRP